MKEQPSWVKTGEVTLTLKLVGFKFQTYFPTMQFVYKKNDPNFLTVFKKCLECSETQNKHIKKFHIFGRGMACLGLRKISGNLLLEIYRNFSKY